MNTTTDELVTDLILAEEARLRRLARRLTRCDADAEDLVQNTLLRAFRARRGFVPGTSIRAWTATILRRVFLTDVVRTKRRGVENDTDVGGLVDRAPDGRRSSFEDAPALERLAERLEDPVKRALERVPAVYLAPFLLSIVEDLTCTEIARRLAIPEGTAMSRIHRAREHLKRDLVYGRAEEAAAPRRRWGVLGRIASAASRSAQMAG